MKSRKDYGYKIELSGNINESHKFFKQNAKQNILHTYAGSISEVKCNEFWSLKLTRLAYNCYFALLTGIYGNYKISNDC